jgi:hypothetical protein
MLASFDLFQGAQQFGRFNFADWTVPDFGFSLTLELAVALQGSLGFLLRLALGVEPLVRHLAECPRRGSGTLVGFAFLGRIDALGEQALASSLASRAIASATTGYEPRRWSFACRRNGRPAARVSKLRA